MQQKSNVIEVCLKIEAALTNRQPLSVIRLGDREGGMLAYPELLGRSAVDRCYKDWFGHTDISDEASYSIAQQMRDAVRQADVVGVPRTKQTQLHPHYQAVFDAAEHYSLIKHGTMLTDAALHRYLQFTLLFRKLLWQRDVVGVVSPRDVADSLKRVFKIGAVEHYLVRGQSKYEGRSTLPHFPDRFAQLQEQLSVPYPGALFLVGAGGLGKIYCQWLKERGAVAIDIGAIFDAWSNVKSRLVHPCHSIDCYADVPTISLPQSVQRFNDLCDHFQLDTERLKAEAYPELAGVTW
ncbi:GT-D fold domain-containing protein [Alteromonas halophila]|uniref:GT-D fold-like domain-containing protein n=1 Tax=Alteromonas halophila TaxID=516698 RepID=A0A918JNL6_9ALTE|nr:hypothetical protein [Alteromonas halophila]GGW92606.1 hypothetical protein GCM10007391_28740 [Alteromonas halophila]